MVVLVKVGQCDSPGELLCVTVYWVSGSRSLQCPAKSDSLWRSRERRCLIFQHVTLYRSDAIKHTHTLNNSSLPFVLGVLTESVWLKRGSVKVSGFYITVWHMALSCWLTYHSWVGGGGVDTRARDLSLFEPGKDPARMKFQVLNQKIFFE